MNPRRPSPESLAGDDHAALFGLLADGRHHRLDALAAAVGATSDQQVRTALEALASAGISLWLDASGARAAPCIPLDRQSVDAAFATMTADRRTAPPWGVRVVFTTGSTNADLLAEVRRRNPGAGPLALAGEFQSAGRGRLGRRWRSAGGVSLTVSFAIPVDRRLAELDGVTLACGLAVHRVVTGYGVAARLKWPNDVLVDGRKLAGILVEAHVAGDRTTLVVGVGLNVIGEPPPLDAAAAGAPLATAALAAPGVSPIDRNLLIARLGRALEDRLADFAMHGFAPVAATWNAVDAYRDRRVVVGAPGGSPIAGIARGVDDAGALLLDVGGERRRVTVGDVSLRPAPADERLATS